ncbi:MAG: DnaJ family domain-containing protein [Nocardioidaceae bacterium]
MSDDEQRLHRAAVTRAAHQAPPPVPDDEDDEPDDAPAQRMEQQALWVDLQVRKAMERGEFDNLPGAGKPLKLPDRHDPDWWVKQLIEREKITGVLPPALGLRKEDAELDAALDREATEDGVRRVVDDFNRRVVEARRQLQGGPPVVTSTRDPDAEVAAWQGRRAARRERARAAAEQAGPQRASRRWWRGRSRD